MTCDVVRAGALNYAPCRYGKSRILFRGPQRRLDHPYIAFLGGTETYGKFVASPFPALVESDVGFDCINFGIANAGVDVLLNDPLLAEAASGARLTVLQVVGALNLSNRFYTVHPRRNDRFVRASRLLASIYPEVDFAEFHFTRHLLDGLMQVSPSRFEVVRNELRTAWLARMKSLLDRMEGDVLLLWFADRSPDEAMRWRDGRPGAVPLFVTRPMLEELRPRVARIVEVAASPEALAAGTAGMVFGKVEVPAARRMLGPKAHGEAARQIAQALREFL